MHCKPYYLASLLLLILSGCYKSYDIVADVTPPGEVKNLSIEKRDVDVAVTWTPPSDKDLIAYQVSLYYADNQGQVMLVDRPKDSAGYTFRHLAAGNYYLKVRTRDKQNNLSDGDTLHFSFLSKAPVNVKHINAAIYWNVVHVSWDSLTDKDFKTTVDGQSIIEPVDSVIVEVDSIFQRVAVKANATSVVVPDLPDGYHYIKVYTHGTSGYYSAEYVQSFPKVTFGEKFVRVKGGGFDFYIAKYEVTAAEFKDFIVNEMGITQEYGVYKADNSKVEDTAWFKWWYGTDPTERPYFYMMGFNTWEFSYGPGGWISNRYAPEDAFGRVSWEGAMLYSLIKYNGRCPTKEEWLYAAKGGPLSNGYDYAGGNDPDAVGWWGFPPGSNTFLNPPGKKNPNELGIYDMSGNASEILYELGIGDPGTLGTIQIIGGSMGPIHFWGNEGEDFGPDNTLKPKLSDPEIIKNTGLNQNSFAWRIGIRVLIPHGEIVKLPFNRFKYEF